MAHTRQQRMVRSASGAEVAQQMREKEAAQGAQHWPDLFRDLLRRTGDEDLVERVEAHWLPDIRNGQAAHALPEDALFFLKVWAYERRAEDKARAPMTAPSKDKGPAADAAGPEAMRARAACQRRR